MTSDSQFEGFPFPLTDPASSLQSLKFLVHAPPGIGKTWLAGTAADEPTMRPVLFIDTEGGTLTIRGKDVQIVNVKSYVDMVKVIKWLRENPDKFKTVVLDSLTEFQKIVMQEIIRAEVANSPRARDPEVPEQRDWQKSHERIRKVVRGLRDIPNTHIIFTCLTREVKAEGDGPITFKPSLPGQLADEIAGFIDIVGYLHIERTVETVDGKRNPTLARRIQFQPGKQRVIVKDRSDNLGTIIEDPTLPKMMAAIRGDKPEKDTTEKESKKEVPSSGGGTATAIKTKKN